MKPLAAFLVMGEEAVKAYQKDVVTCSARVAERKGPREGDMDTVSRKEIEQMSKTLGVTLRIHGASDRPTRYDFVQPPPAGRRPLGLFVASGIQAAYAFLCGYEAAYFRYQHADEAVRDRSETVKEAGR